MDVNPTTLFILPVGNTLPTTGSTDALLPTQFGVYRNGYDVATTGNIAASEYIYLAQGRPQALPGVGTKRSDKIALANVVEWYKVASVSTYSPEIYVVSNFTIQCGETITLTLRAHSAYTDSAFFNGLQRSVTIQAPCCACGADPCTVIDPQALVDQMIVKARADFHLNRLFTFQRVGTGTSSTLVIVSKALDIYGQPCDIAAFPYEYDRIWYRVFIRPGAATTQDFQIFDPCDQAGTVTLTQRSTYPSGSSAEIKQIETNFYSYQALHKHLFRNANYNGAYVSEVVAGQYYDSYYIRFREYKDDASFANKVGETYVAGILIPTGQAATLETLLATYLGAAKNKSTTVPTTTSTTSTSSTSTTSTTTLEP